MRTSAGKLIPLSKEYPRMASMTSRLSSTNCGLERRASLVRSFSDISDRRVQKSSTDMDARIENCNRRSDAEVAPALERTASNAPGSAKRNISGEPGVGAVDATYRSTTCDTV